MDRDTWLTVVEMRGCPGVPCRVVISAAVWNRHADRLRDAVESHPGIEVEILGAADGQAQGGLADRYRPGERWVDRWGCGWDNRLGGIEGQVVEHPLEDWDALPDLQPPDPAGGTGLDPLDWDREAERIAAARRDGRVARGGVSHGFLFQRLYYLRGFNNLMLDVAAGDPRLDELIAVVRDFNMGLVRRYVRLGVDEMYFGDDLGTQKSLTISPSHWRRYVKPAYAELFGACRRAGVKVYFHSDGRIVDVMRELAEVGADIVNPQDLCNGLDNIGRELRGRACIDLDIDRQFVLPRGSPEDVRTHLRRCVDALASPRGGLMMICGIYPPTPPQNVEALLDEMSRCSPEGSRPGGTPGTPSR